MSRIKKDRNIDLVKKRKAGWSFRKLAAHFNIDVARAYQIIQEENARKKARVEAVDN